MNFVGAVVLMVAFLEILAIAIEIFGWRKESAVVRWRRISLHVSVWMIIVGGFFAIIHFGPLRPVHEWIR